MPEISESKWRWKISNWRWWLVFHVVIALLVLYGPKFGGHIIFWWLVCAVASCFAYFGMAAYLPSAATDSTSKSIDKSKRIIFGGPFLILIYVLIRSQFSVWQASTELARLCEIGAGTTIHQSISAKGYYDDYGSCYSCWNRLLDSNYEYIEFCNDSPATSDAIDEPGCWRIYRSPRVSGKCNERIDSRLAKKSSSAPVAGFLESQCFATIKIEKPASEAGIFRENISWNFDNYHESVFYKYITRIERLDTNELIAEHRTYRSTYDPNAAPFGSSGASCERTPSQVPFSIDLVSMAIDP